MARNGRVVIDRKGLNAALSQPAMRDELRRIVERIELAAKAGAPVDSGAYRDGIHSEIDDGWVRPRGRVYADAAHSLAVEARTGNLARALGSE